MTSLPVVQDRPIAARWRCQQSGDCCTQPADVVMTTMEAAELLRAKDPDVVLNFTKMDESFVSLKAGPCPLYDARYQTCTVYEVRPYNCRRFGCMRPDPKTEPWESTSTGECANREDRITISRSVRRTARDMQETAKVWARAHGWRPDGVS